MNPTVDPENSLSMSSGAYLQPVDASSLMSLSYGDELNEFTVFSRERSHPGHHLGVGPVVVELVERFISVVTESSVEIT